MYGARVAGLLVVAGYSLINLRSVSGDSVAEAFDHAVGWLSLGLAVLASIWAIARR
jgi:hypothetical protein